MPLGGYTERLRFLRTGRRREVSALGPQGCEGTHLADALAMSARTPDRLRARRYLDSALTMHKQASPLLRVRS
jgi:hypothetical protein